MAHVSEQKKKTVEEFVELIDRYPVIGLVDMGNIPAKQLQNMRAALRDKDTVLRMTKKRLMKIAFSKSKKENITGLEKHFKGMPALIFTEENPFKLYAGLQKTKSKAPAKAGQHAPKDIQVKAGPTSFAPGPIIGQLGQFGIKTGVEGGKLAIKQDTVVAKKGAVISAELAGILTRIGIEPMEIGLDLTAAYENGTIFESEVLYVDEKEFFNKFVSAYSESFNLAVYSAYPTGETIKALLGKASNDSMALAVSQNILTDETTEAILRKAYCEMLSLSSSLPEEALSDELKQNKASPAVAQEDTKKQEDDKPDAPKEEEPQADAAVGLGSLFG
ncbi:50S ribosomal protein L10 [Candidatus Woesearchaeota archaeon]|nr:50S ribosomal protein L10 [Candidatus Woesearchaeota archaeon]